MGKDKDEVCQQLKWGTNTLEMLVNANVTRQLLAPQSDALNVL